MTVERVKSFLVMAGAWTTWDNLCTLAVHRRMTPSDFFAGLEIGILIAALTPSVNRMFSRQKQAGKGLNTGDTPSV